MWVAAVASEQGKSGIFPLSSQSQPSQSRSKAPSSPWLDGPVKVLEPWAMTWPREGGTMWWVIVLAPFAVFVFADTAARPSSQVKVGRPCFERHLFAVSTTFCPPIVAPVPPDDGAGFCLAGAGTTASSFLGAET